MSTPRIYVASLADYNAGTLHGTWIDATQSADDIRDEIQAMLKASKEPYAEEYAIHDFEGFGSYRLSEYEDLETVADIAEAIEEHGELITELLNHLGTDDPREAIKYHENNYQGEFKTLEDWAERFLEDTGSLQEIPESLRYYFDFEAYARDARLSGDIFEIEFGGALHVYFNS